MPDTPGGTKTEQQGLRYRAKFNICWLPLRGQRQGRGSDTPVQLPQAVMLQGPVNCDHVNNVGGKI